MPSTGPSGVEDRTGNGGVAGEHTIVLTYANSPVGASASVTKHNPPTGVGTVSGVSFSGNDMIVNLTGVSDKQVLTLSTSGGAVSSEILPVGFLAGDTNGNRAVSGSDVAQTKAQSGNPAGAGNFRTDVNANGAVSSSDVSIVKSVSGNTVPLTP